MNLTLGKKLKVLYKTSTLKYCSICGLILMGLAFVSRGVESVYIIMGFLQAAVCFFVLVDSGMILWTNKIFTQLPIKQNEQVNLVIINLHAIGIALFLPQLLVAVINGNIMNIPMILGSFFITLVLFYISLFLTVDDMKTGVGVVVNGGGAANTVSYKVEDKSNREEVKAVRRTWRKSILFISLMIFTMFLSTSECVFLYNSDMAEALHNIQNYVLIVGAVLYAIVFFFGYRLEKNPNRIYVD